MEKVPVVLTVIIVVTVQWEKCPFVQVHETEKDKALATQQHESSTAMAPVLKIFFDGGETAQTRLW